MIERFVNRLHKIGIDVELVANYPWIYIDRVNGVQVTEPFRAEHGFTAFFAPVKPGQRYRFSDRQHVFAKIREMTKGE